MHFKYTIATTISNPVLWLNCFEGDEIGNTHCVEPHLKSPKSSLLVHRGFTCIVEHAVGDVYLMDCFWRYPPYSGHQEASSSFWCYPTCTAQAWLSFLWGYGQNHLDLLLSYKGSGHGLVWLLHTPCSLWSNGLHHNGSKLWPSYFMSCLLYPVWLWTSCLIFFHLVQILVPNPLISWELGNDSSWYWYGRHP